MAIESIIEEGRFIVREETYVIVKANRIVEDAFAVINDGKEITIVVEQWTGSHALFSKDCIDIDRDWKIITFDMNLPFELVGFISTIASALAKEKISIFVISAFSTDHLLVKNRDLEDTIRVLTKLGFKQI